MLIDHQSRGTGEERHELMLRLVVGAWILRGAFTVNGLLTEGLAATLASIRDHKSDVSGWVSLEHGL